MSLPVEIRAVTVSGPPTDADLVATATFDHDTDAVREWALGTVGNAEEDVGRSALLFADVRDRIRYDPYAIDLRPEAFAASATLSSERSWCVPKAILLVAGARAVGIPARIGFADVRNHLSSEKLRERMGSDLFVFHGYASLHVGGKWLKASPAFNAGLCERFGVPPLEFDGSADALLHAYDGEGRRHMEYVNDHGTRTGVPLQEMYEAFRANYAHGQAAAEYAPRADPVFDAAPATCALEDPFERRRLERAAGRPGGVDDQLV
ncbi:MAG TPA: transglutaminase family protein [Solirubrobacteraceae bacterium]|nr:transglutaminase family protein [Solirubrobacteraceae bacterium]